MSSLSPKMEEAINGQINNELHSSYSYLAMAAWLEHQHYTGSAHWMRLQSQEEHAHAMRLYDFLLMRHSRVLLKPIAEPRSDFETVVDVFATALAQEEEVTRQIESLYELAFHEKAFAALVELEWFIKEQVEEEKSARDVLHKFRLVADDPASLLDLDRELGERKPDGDDGEAA